MTEKQLVIQPPDKKAKGYLRRMRALAKFMELVKGDEFPVAAVDALVDFLLTMVEEPKDKEEARELLLDLSQKDFEAILAQLTEAMKPAVPPKNAAP